jgi:Mg-chelatase subunit ChlI
VFTQLLLGDEINRAPAKTQSSLLEAMQERSVTVDGTTRPLPDPFVVIATQNPIESQGTYPLPEAQLDRFLFKLDVRHPTTAVEKAILVNHLAGFDASALDKMGLNRVTTPEELVAMQGAIRGVRVEDSLLEYIADIVGPHARAPVAVLRRVAARVDRAARRRAGARRQRRPRLRDPRRRQGAGPGGAAAPRGVAARRRDRGRVGRRLRRRDPARGPRARDDRRLTHMPLVPSRRLVLLALGPLLFGMAMILDQTLLLPMLAADGALVALALLDALLARGRKSSSSASRPTCCRSGAPTPCGCACARRRGGGWR